jgi:hypothetical protein
VREAAESSKARGKIANIAENDSSVRLLRYTENNVESRRLRKKRGKAILLFSAVTTTLLTCMFVSLVALQLFFIIILTNVNIKFELFFV